MHWLYTRTPFWPSAPPLRIEKQNLSRWGISVRPVQFRWCWNYRDIQYNVSQHTNTIICSPVKQNFPFIRLPNYCIFQWKPEFKLQVFNIFYTIVCGITTLPWFWAVATICDSKVATWLQEDITMCHQFKTSWHILQFVILWLYTKWLYTIKFYIIVSFCNLTLSQRTFYISVFSFHEAMKCGISVNVPVWTLFYLCL